MATAKRIKSDFELAIELFCLKPSDVFCFTDHGTYYGIITVDAKKFILPKDKVKTKNKYINKV